MKKLLIGVIVFVLALSFTLPLYAEEPYVSENASDNAAFGQARAGYTLGFIDDGEPNKWGGMASDRAGNNSDLNHWYMDWVGVGPYK